MAKEQEYTTNYSIHGDYMIGEVQIADEVVAIIAGLAFKGLNSEDEA